MKKAPVKVKLKHDYGTTTVVVRASSLEEAKQLACYTEKAPLCGVVYAKSVKPTIYTIKRLTEETSPYFFSRDTMKFFKQRMSDFKVTRHGDDSFLIQAQGEHGTTKRIFNPFTNQLESYEN